MSFFQTLLFLHIVCGSTSLLLGLFIMITKKGNKTHKTRGKIYYYALLITTVAGLPMSCIHPNYFLFIISVFTAYMLLSGKRYLLKKKATDVKLIDWLLTGIILLFGLTFLGFGIYRLVNLDFFGIVFLSFGLISVLFVRQDYKNFTVKTSIKNYWLTTHIQRMTGSYIASVTACSVVNNTFLPSVIAWLLPTLTIAPLIIKWTKMQIVKEPSYDVVTKNDKN